MREWKMSCSCWGDDWDEEWGRRPELDVDDDDEKKNNNGREDECPSKGVLGDISCAQTVTSPT